MGELNKFSDDEESSTGEGKKDSRERDGKRWVRPPLVPRSLELIRDAKEVPPPVPPPSLMEQALGKDALKKNTEDDDEEAESKSGAQAEGQEAAADQSAESTDTENQSESAADGSAQTERAEGAEEDPEYVAVDLPDAAKAESIQAEEAPEEIDDETVLHVRRQPEPTVPESAPSASTEEDQTATTPLAAAGGASPPIPPTGRTFGSPGTPDQGPVPNWNAAPSQPDWTTKYNTAPAPQVSVEQYKSDLKETAEESEKRGLRRGLVAGFLTGYILKAYLDGRKRERYEKATKKQIEGRDEKITNLQREQQQLAEQMSARNEENRRLQQEQARKQAEKTVRLTGEEQIFDKEGNEIILQPGWHIERSAGGYSVVLDEHNRVVHDAIHYGEAFRRDQKREQLDDDLFTAIGSGAPVGGPQGSDFSSVPIITPQSSVRQDVAPGGYEQRQPTVDLQHRLPKPRNQVLATITSPWMWTAVAILIIVYFIAALA